MKKVVSLFALFSVVFTVSLIANIELASIIKPKVADAAISGDCTNFYSNAQNADAKTVVWASKTWDVIGINANNVTRGVAGPNNTVTLVLDNASRPSSTIRYGGTEDTSQGYSKWNDNPEYKNSNLQQAMTSYYTALSTDQKSKVVPRDFVGYGTSATSESASGYNAQGVYGDTVNNQYFWPLSMPEAAQLKASVRAYSRVNGNGYWTRSYASGYLNNQYMYVVTDGGAATANNYGQIMADTSSRTSAANYNYARPALYLSYDEYKTIDTSATTSSGVEAVNIGSCSLNPTIEVDGKTWDIVGINNNGNEDGVNFGGNNTASLILSKKSLEKFEGSNGKMRTSFSTSNDSEYSSSDIKTKLENYASSLTDSNIKTVNLSDVNVTNAKLFPLSHTNATALNFSERIFLDQYWTRTKADSTHVIAVNQLGDARYSSVSNAGAGVVPNPNSTSYALRPAMVYQLTNDIEYLWANRESSWNGLPLPSSLPTPSLSCFSGPYANQTYTGSPITYDAHSQLSATCQGLGHITVNYSSDNPLTNQNAVFTSTAPTNVGTYYIRLNIAGSAAYQAATLDFGSWQITKAPLTVKAKNIVVLRSSSLPAANRDNLQFTATGLQNGEKQSDVFTGTLGYGTNSTNSPSPFTCSDTSVVRELEDCIVRNTLDVTNNYDITQFDPGDILVEPPILQPADFQVEDIGEETYGDTFTLKAEKYSGSGQISYHVASGNASIIGDQISVKDAGQICVYARIEAYGNYDEGYTQNKCFTAKKYKTTISNIMAINRYYSYGDTLVNLDTSSSSLTKPSGFGADKIHFSGCVGHMNGDEAGNSKVVNITGCALTGADFDNYEIGVISEVKVNILKIDPSVAVQLDKNELFFGDAAPSITVVRDGDGAISYLCGSLNCGDDASEVGNISQNGAITVRKPGKFSIKINVDEGTNFNAASSGEIEIEVNAHTCDNGADNYPTCTYPPANCPNGQHSVGGGDSPAKCEDNDNGGGDTEGSGSGSGSSGSGSGATGGAGSGSSGSGATGGGATGDGATGGAGSGSSGSGATGGAGSGSSGSGATGSGATGGGATGGSSGSGAGSGAGSGSGQDDLSSQKLCSDVKKVNSKKPFKDIKVLGSTRKTAINWLYQHSITLGMTKTKYAPQTSVNRGSMSQFIWKVCGKPDKVKITQKKITDYAPKVAKVWFKKDKNVATVKKLNLFRYNAIMWMANNGIIGTVKASTKYNPQKTLSRSDMALWMYNLAKKNGDVIKGWLPKMSTRTHFKDISSKTKNATAIWWLYEKEVAFGSKNIKTKKWEFVPKGSINRGSMAEFLQKLYTNVLSK